MLSAELRRSLETATAQYQTDLVANPVAVSYLVGRGITTEIAERFRLGFVANPIDGHDDFRGLVSIPYLRPAGVVAMKFRRLDDGKPKYLNVPGCGTHLYNTEALRLGGRVVGLCEGEFDAMVLDGICGISAVGIPGVTQWKGKPHWWRLFEGRNVLIFPDFDTGETNHGDGLAKDVVDRLEGARIVRLPGPEGEETKSDVTSVFLRFGVDEIRKRAGLGGKNDYGLAV